MPNLKCRGTSNSRSSLYLIQWVQRTNFFSASVIVFIICHPQRYLFFIYSSFIREDYFSNQKIQVTRVPPGRSVLCDSALLPHTYLGLVRSRTSFSAALLAPQGLFSWRYSLPQSGFLDLTGLTRKRPLGRRRAMRSGFLFRGPPHRHHKRRFVFVCPLRIYILSPYLCRLVKSRNRAQTLFPELTKFAKVFLVG